MTRPTLTWQDYENDPPGWEVSKKHYSPKSLKAIEQLRADLMKRAERIRKKKKT